nr:uncharacterized protein LOC113727076 isoform X2 [Coffea arabica]
MALVYNLPQSFPWNPSRIQKMRTSSGSYISHRQPQKLQKVICAKERKRCLSLGKSKATVLGAPSDSRKNKFSFVLRITSIAEKHFCNLAMQEKRNYHQVEIRAASLRCYNIDIEFFYNYIISNKEREDYLHLPHHTKVLMESGAINLV